MKKLLFTFVALLLLTIPSFGAVGPVECTQQLFDLGFCPVVGETGYLVRFWLNDNDGFTCTQAEVDQDLCLAQDIGRPIQSTARKVMAPYSIGYEPKLSCTRELVLLGVCAQGQADVDNPLTVEEYINERMFEEALMNPAAEWENTVTIQELQGTLRQRKKIEDSTP